jgi:hypothetical protein
LLRRDECEPGSVEWRPNDLGGRDALWDSREDGESDRGVVPEEVPAVVKFFFAGDLVGEDFVGDLAGDEGCDWK